MTLKERNLTLSEDFELLHKPNNDLKWRESYYFNWADLKNKISGFSTIGILPNDKKRELVFVLFLDNKMEVYYKEPSLENYVDDITIMLRDNKLTYKMIKPLQTWEIDYKCRKFEFNLTFETRFSPFDFGQDSSGSWHRHFEASGIVTGEMKYRNKSVRMIRGFGERDKSWGYRDWHQFDKWFAGHFQFKKWSCAFRKDYEKKKVNLSGYIANDKGNTPLAQLEIKTINDADQFQSPLTSMYVITDIEGKSYSIKSKRMEQNSHIRFAREFPGGNTELFEQMVIMESIDTGEIGTGMAEYLRTVKFD